MKTRTADFQAIVRQHQETTIPKELNEVVKAAIAQGLESDEALSRSQRPALLEHPEPSRPAMRLRTGLAFVAAIAIFVAGINLSPNFADGLSRLPLIGELVKVLTFSQGIGTGGVITDGTDVSQLELSKLGEVEQLSLHFEQSGEPQPLAGAYELKYQKAPYTMMVKVSGARMLSALSDFEAMKQSSLVSDVYRIITLDDSTVRFMIVFKTPVVYEVKEMANPSSLVIQIAKTAEEQDPLPYSLRSETMVQGEGLAMIEEVLMADFGDLRVLRDGSGSDQFFVEAGRYSSLSEAEAAIAMAQARGVTLMIVKQK